MTARKVRDVGTNEVPEHRLRRRRPPGQDERQDAEARAPRHHRRCPVHLSSTEKGSAMIVINGDIEIDPASEAAFLEAVSVLVDATTAEEGCERYAFFRHLDR